MIRKKYPISDWVISIDALEEGDWVTYVNYRDVEVVAEYKGVLDKSAKGVIVVQPETSEVVDIISIYDTIVYKFPRDKKPKKGCSCGAKHTSNPKFHFRYCEAK